MAGGLPKRRWWTVEEYQDIQVGRRGVESGPGATGQHRGYRVGEVLSDKSEKQAERLLVPVVAGAFRGTSSA